MNPAYAYAMAVTGVIILYAVSLGWIAPAHRVRSFRAGDADLTFQIAAIFQAAAIMSAMNKARTRRTGRVCVNFAPA
jgi:hypothetical protein